MIILLNENLCYVVLICRRLVHVFPVLAILRTSGHCCWRGTPKLDKKGLGCTRNSETWQIQPFQGLYEKIDWWINADKGLLSVWTVWQNDPSAPCLHVRLEKWSRGHADDWFPTRMKRSHTQNIPSRQCWTTVSPAALVLTPGNLLRRNFGISCMSTRVRNIAPLPVISCELGSTRIHFLDLARNLWPILVIFLALDPSKIPPCPWCLL